MKFISWLLPGRKSSKTVTVCGTPPAAPSSACCDLNHSRAAGTYVVIDDRTYILTARHVGFVYDADGQSLLYHWRSNFQDVDLMAVHLPEGAPKGRVPLALSARDAGNRTWRMVRRPGGTTRATTLSADLTANSCCVVSDPGAIVSNELQESIQTEGECMEGGDSGATVLTPSDALAGTAVGSDKGHVWFVRVDESTLVDGELLTTVLARGPGGGWVEISKVSLLWAILSPVFRRALGKG